MGQIDFPISYQSISPSISPKSSMSGSSILSGTSKGATNVVGLLTFVSTLFLFLTLMSFFEEHFFPRRGRGGEGEGGEPNNTDIDFIMGVSLSAFKIGVMINAPIIMRCKKIETGKNNHLLVNLFFSSKSQNKTFFMFTSLNLFLHYLYVIFWRFFRSESRFRTSL